MGFFGLCLCVWLVLEGFGIDDQLQSHRLSCILGKAEGIYQLRRDEREY